MKKGFLLLIFISALTSVNAQRKEGGLVVLQETIFDSLSLSKEKLKDKSKEWIGKTFRDAKNNISSETEGSIVCKYVNVVYGSNAEPTGFHHTMTLDFKDGKVRLRITADQSDKGYEAAAFFYGPKEKRIWKEWLQKLMNDSETLKDSFYNALTTKDDW